MKKYARFVDLGDRPGKCCDAPMKARKYYPSFSINKKIKGMDKPGQTKVIKVKVRMSRAELSTGDSPRFGYEIAGYEE